MLSVLFAAALVFSPADADFALRTAGDFVGKCTPRDAGTVRGRIAANYILDAASAVGADVRLDRFEAETPKGRKWFTNLESEFCSNPSNSWVVLLSHYDTKPGVACPGANDGASTTALLIALARILSESRELGGNVMLIWTDGEECMGSTYGEDNGLWGSRRAVSRIEESKKNVRAVICADMLGDRDLQISLPKNSSPVLRKIAQYAAKRIGLSAKVREIPELVKDDHVPFIDAGYKAVNFIDFEYGRAPGLNDYWHTPEDTPDKLSKESLLDSGRLIVEMLNILL